MTEHEKQLYRDFAAPIAHEVYVWSVNWLGDLPYAMPQRLCDIIGDRLKYGAAVLQRLLPEGNPYRQQGLLEYTIERLRNERGTDDKPGLYDCVPSSWIEQLERSV